MTKRNHPVRPRRLTEGAKKRLPSKRKHRGDPPEEALVGAKKEESFPTYCPYCRRLNGQHDEGCPYS